MVKKKVLKLLVGEAYDKDSKKNLPVYASFWQNEDGSYTRTEKLYVQEVEIPEKTAAKQKVEA
jgi:hypothetical protein